MKLTIATTFIAVSASAPLISTSEVAASILEHENSKGSVRTAAKIQGVECAYVNGVTVRKPVDVGVLSCGVGKVCVEDSTSTMGGRCETLYLPMMKPLLWNLSGKVNSARSVWVYLHAFLALTNPRLAVDPVMETMPVLI